MIAAPVEHKNKHPYRIVVVDDVQQTAQYFADQLSRVFESVVVMTPDEATTTLGTGFEANVLVTDLRFIWIHSVDNGIRLMQSLWEKCPPAVVLTASVSGSTLWDLTAQAVHTDGTSLFRWAMKWKSINTLTAQILWTIADAQKVPAKTRAEWIKNITITDFNNTGDFPMELSNVVALLAENIRNYVRSTREKLEILKAQYGLENWESWKEIRDTMEWQLEQFARYNSAKIIGNGEKDTLNALHEMNSRVILLDIDRVRPPQEHQNRYNALGIIHELSRENREFQGEIQNAFKKAENICCPNFSFDQDIQKAIWESNLHFREIWYPSSKLRWKTIKDHGRFVTEFFQRLGQQFNNSGCELDVRAIDEEDLIWDGSEMQEKLQKKWDGVVVTKFK